MCLLIWCLARKTKKNVFYYWNCLSFLLLMFSFSSFRMANRVPGGSEGRGGKQGPLALPVLMPLALQVKKKLSSGSVFLILFFIFSLSLLHITEGRKYMSCPKGLVYFILSYRRTHFSILLSQSSHTNTYAMGNGGYRDPWNQLFGRYHYVFLCLSLFSVPLSLYLYP